MSIIEGIGDEVVHFFVAVFVIIIVYIAWWSTRISEQRQFRTVLLLDRRRRPTRSILRGVRLPRQLSNHTETVTISEGTSSTSSVQSEQPLETPDSVSPTQSALATPSKPDEEPSSSTDNTLEEEREIIHTMDAESQNTVRLRRIAHFEGGETSRSEATTVETADDTFEAVDNNLSKSKAFLSKKDQEVKDSEEAATASNSNEEQPSITIKLKYINDNVKVVDGKLDELLGDFKMRHFREELNSNKTVKLIFNGQVLKQDRHTLQSCGIFNNCVVHCLIHQKRPVERRNSQESHNFPNADFLGDNPFIGVANLNNNNQGIDWDLGNFLFALVSFVLLAAWYFRYVYAHLYTVTATVGLIIITGVFSIVLVGTYFPDNEIPSPNTRFRIARAERIETQR